MDFARPARIDPRKAVAQVTQFGATNLFGSPAVVRALGSHGAPLPSLRRAISAGAPARADQIERFARLLAPGVEIFTPYGATEALPVASIGSREILTETRHLTDRGNGVCVGRPVPGVTVRVIPITDDAIPEWDERRVLPEGEIGEFAVRGPVVTAAYFGRPEATRLAKIRDPRTGALWHRMGDVGYYDDVGRLWFCGRKSHRVVTPHGTLFTDQVEPVFNTVKGVYRTALVGVTRDGVTHPVVCVERWTGRHEMARARFLRVKIRVAPPRPWEWLEAELRTTAKLCEHTRAGVTFVEYRGSFPVDVRHNSKIFREKLAAWADRKLGPAWRPTA